MKKVIALKVFIGIVITLSVLMTAILIVIPREEVFEYLYQKQKMEEVTGISAFEAELNYDGIVQQIVGHREISGLSTYGSSEELENKIERMRNIYRTCKWICGLGVLIAISGLIVLRNQRWYECLNLAGCCIVGTDLFLLFLSSVIKPLRLFIWKSQYGEFLGYDPLLVSLLPEKWGLYMATFGWILILIIGLVFMLLHIGSRKIYKPHKF